MAAAYALSGLKRHLLQPRRPHQDRGREGKSLPVPSAGCTGRSRTAVAQAVNYILQGVLDFPGGHRFRPRPGAHRLPGGRQDRHLQRGRTTPAPRSRPSRATPPPWSATSRCSTRPRRPLVHDDRRGRLLPPGLRRLDAQARCSARTRRLGLAADLRPGQPVGSHDFEPVPPGSALWSPGNGQSSSSRRSRRRRAGKGNGKGGGTGGGNGGGNGGGRRRRQRRERPPVLP